MKLRFKIKPAIFILLVISLFFTVTAVRTGSAHPAFFGWLQEQVGTAGMLDDRQIHLPSRYADWTPPPRGMSFTDSAYGSPIMRLSDGVAQFNDAVHHEYSSMSPFNSDNTRILLLTDKLGFYVADLRGNVIIPPDAPELPGLGGRSEPRWSVTDPNVFYYHIDNQIRKFDLATRQSTIVKTFPQYSKINFGHGESDISEDGNHMVIIGDDQYVGVYTFSAGTLGPTMDVNGLGGGFDYFDMTPNNNVIVRWGDRGVGRYKGFELYDMDMNFLRQVHTAGAHADRGRDLNGDEVLLVLSATDDNPPPGCETNGVEKIRLSDGKKTCLIGLNFDVEAHISANTNGSNPWVLVQLTDKRLGTANSNATLPTDWQSRWKPYYNEIILVKIDGSEARRIAHHRSRALDNYWYLPRAAISRDGSLAVFDSNFGFQPFYYYTDVFLINLKKYSMSSVSAASYLGDTIATEAITTAFGSGLATTTAAVSTLPLPTIMGETQILVRDSAGDERPAPLFYISPTQLNYQMPPGTAPGLATVTVFPGNNRISAETLRITSVRPGLFSADTSGRGVAVGYVVRVKPDSSQSFESLGRFDPVQNKYVHEPIDLSQATDDVILVLYGTGFRNRTSLSAVSVNIGGVDAQVLYVGSQGYFVGLDQLNARIPRALIGRGLVDIVMKADNQTANTMQISIK